jgi:hypothetical protein
MTDSEKYYLAEIEKGKKEWSEWHHQATDDERETEHSARAKFWSPIVTFAVVGAMYSYLAKPLVWQYILGIPQSQLMTDSGVATVSGVTTANEAPQIAILFYGVCILLGLVAFFGLMKVLQWMVKEIAG